VSRARRREAGAVMKPFNMVVYEAARTLTCPVLSLVHRVHARGVSNIPEDGGAIIVANHRCYLDPFVLAHCVPRFINFAAGSHLFEVPGAAALLRLPGFFPLNIYGGADSDRDLEYAKGLLSDGELVGIFPEGIESFMNIYRDSRISSFKTGFVVLALDGRVPIIPVAIAPGLEKEMIKIPGPLVKPFVRHPGAGEGVQLITYRHVECRVGRPVDLSPYYGETRSKDLIDRISNDIRRRVIRLYDGEDEDE